MSEHRASGGTTTGRYVLMRLSFRSVDTWDETEARLGHRLLVYYGVLLCAILITSIRHLLFSTWGLGDCIAKHV